MKDVIVEISIQRPGAEHAVSLCKNCPRRGSSNGRVYVGVVFQNMTPGNTGWEYVSDTLRFTGDLGSGLSDDMPVNTTLGDIDSCKNQLYQLGRDSWGIERFENVEPLSVRLRGRILR